MSPPPLRSTFVTVVAWIFIALSGFGTLMGALQSIMVAMIFSDPMASQSVQAAPPGTPAFMALMAGHMQYVFPGFLLVSVFTLVSSIGLLKRLNWARLCFVGVMALAIVWNLGGLVVQLAMFSFMRDRFPAGQVEGALDMQPVFIVIGVVSAIFAVGFSVLHGWIAKRLLSAQIAAEFRRA